MSDGKCLDKCISAGMSLQRDSDSYRADKSTPVIFKQNVRGIVKVDDLKVPHSELAMHVGAAGCDILAWIMTCSGVTVVYEKDGCCGISSWFTERAHAAAAHRYHQADVDGW